MYQKKNVFLTGPHSNINPNTGIETPFWVISIGTELEDQDKSYTVNNYEKAYDLAQQIAIDRTIQFINQSQYA